MKLPPPLPAGAAPYGTLICGSCHTLAARKHPRGGLPACPKCGDRLSRYPTTTKPTVPPAKVKLIVEGVTPPLPMERRMFRPQSPIDMWDAAYECAHGLLPHQPCVDCGREGTSASYPGVSVVVDLERAA